MSRWQFIRQLFSTNSEYRTQNAEYKSQESEYGAQDTTKRYDNVKIKNVADGTTIEGNEAVKAYFEREEQMLKKHGESLIFQVYRINMQAQKLEELQGNMLTKIQVNPGLVSGTDTVAIVKKKINPLLEEKPQLLNIKDAEKVTLFFNGRKMDEHSRFYADHFMMLPAWIQVFLHECEFEKVVELALKLKATGKP